MKTDENIKVEIRDEIQCSARENRRADVQREVLNLRNEADGKQELNSSVDLVSY